MGLAVRVWAYVGMRGFGVRGLGLRALGLRDCGSREGSCNSQALWVGISGLGGCQTARILGSIRETPRGGPFLTLLPALLKGTLLRGSISARVPPNPNS